MHWNKIQVAEKTLRITSFKNSGFVHILENQITSIFTVLFECIDINSFQDTEEAEEEESLQILDTNEKAKEFMDLKITDSDEEEENI